ncbi:MAG: tRNA (adenosine(37)-N6)-threonylcarbamoyltransferase complex dimerization subunit type 1 TsaB [bacterium]|nr:tRNA (adenosine(37)-N6)-threonylcarbamoyltransferase complex dimerization subunit type 1 TsaB [bacterium]
MTRMYLIINTIEDDQFSLALADAKGSLMKSITKKGKYIQAEKILPTIDKLVRPKYKYTQLKGIIVSRGPGGFTSIRIGVITANTFSYALNIPVVGLKDNQYKNLDDLAKKGIDLVKKSKNSKMTTPFYGREPNITKPKKKLYKI